jgi:hypothetical protein
MTILEHLDARSCLADAFEMADLTNRGIWSNCFHRS